MAGVVTLKMIAITVVAVVRYVLLASSVTKASVRSPAQEI